MDFSYETQKLLVSYFLTEPDAYTITRAIIKPEYFDARLKNAVRFIQTHTDRYNTLPSFEMVKANSGLDIQPYDNPEAHVDWFVDTTTDFCRKAALESAILAGAAMLEGDKSKAVDIERLIKDALTISILNDIGSDFKQDPAKLLARLSDKSNFVKTGWDELDSKLYGGFTRQSLNIFAGASGSGKSLFLQNIALNWAEAGLNVAYVTLELSEDLVNFRLCSMVSGIATRDIMRDQNAAIIKLRKEVGKMAGTLVVKKMPEGGTTSHTLKSYLKEYQIQKGYRPDVLIVDYMDLMYPNSGKTDVANLFSKDKQVSEEMRGLASEWNIPVVTASQLNRSAVASEDHDHSHIAGGISKINTADNVISIATNKKQRENGVQEIQFLKTRNSNAVGGRMKFNYDSESMRITNHTEPTSSIPNADPAYLMKQPSRVQEMIAKAKKHDIFGDEV